MRPERRTEIVNTVDLDFLSLLLGRQRDVVK
jgi:hypothetical protein